MAIEDAACLGIVFSKKYFNGNVKDALQIYEAVRKPRATKVQAASARARENIHERIGMASQPLLFTTLFPSVNHPTGFSSNTDNPLYKVVDEQKKLTIEEMNRYVGLFQVEPNHPQR